MESEGGGVPLGILTFDHGGQGRDHGQKSRTTKTSRPEKELVRRRWGMKGSHQGNSVMGFGEPHEPERGGDRGDPRNLW